MAASSKWKTVAAMGGGAAAMGALLYYLLKNKSEDEDKESCSTIVDSAAEFNTPVLDPRTATKDDVLKVLLRVLESQDKMKTITKDLMKRIHEHKLTFDQVYDHVKLVQPLDPLEETQLTMQDFDQLLQKYQTDPEITKAVATIMGMSSSSSDTCGKAQSLDVDTIIKIHKFMVLQLKALMNEFQSRSSTAQYDMKPVTIAIQAMVGARVEEVYNVNSEELELAVVLQREGLSSSPEFACANLEMQSTISQLIGFGSLLPCSN